MFKKFSLNRMIILVTIIGFGVLLLDVIVEHWEVFDKEIMVYIPVLYCVLALILGGITVIKWKSKIIRTFQIVLFVSFIVSAAGLYFHLEEEEDDVNLTIEQKEHEDSEKDKSPIAPLAFGGLAVFGLLGTSKKWKAEVIEAEMKTK
jgi:hypothetical protein